MHPKEDAKLTIACDKPACGKPRANLSSWLQKSVLCPSGSGLYAKGSWPRRLPHQGVSGQSVGCPFPFHHRDLTPEAAQPSTGGLSAYQPLSYAAPQGTREQHRREESAFLMHSCVKGFCWVWLCTQNFLHVHSQLDYLEFTLLFGGSSSRGDYM